MISPFSNLSTSSIAVTFLVLSRILDTWTIMSTADAIWLRIAASGRSAAISTIVSSLDSISFTLLACPVARAAAPVAAPAPAAAPAAPKAAPAASGSGETVSSPMPGTILDVKVAAGQAVKSGDILFILEAMKMENEIFAPCDGTVSSVAVSKGAAVNPGDVLCVIG